MTGRETISVCQKYGLPFTYAPKFTIWLSSNALMLIDFDDDAVWQRLLVVRTAKPAQHDRDLHKKLRTPQALSRFLRLAVDGLQDYWENGYVLPPEVIEWRDSAREDLHPLRPWLWTAPYAADPQGWVKTADLRQSYMQHCHDLRVKPLSDGDWLEGLRQLGHGAGKAGRGSTLRVIRGLRSLTAAELKDEAEEPEGTSPL